jgi:hypothetical protein
MKTIYKSLVIITCAFALVQCKSKRDTAVKEEKAQNEKREKGMAMNTLDIDNSYVWPSGTDPFQLLSAQITEQDSLVLEVEYGGGCKEHVFKLISNGMMKKSMPPQCTLYLEHENNDDMCRALLRQKVSFYIGNLAPNGETVVVQLHEHALEGQKLILNAQKK